MIPRRLFWIIDFLVVAAALALAYAMWPVLHPTAVRLGAQLPIGLRAGDAAELPPARTILWIALLAGGVAILVFEVGKGYRSLLEQSRVRVVLTSFAAPVAAAGLVTLGLFFEKRTGWSRLLLVTFLILGGVMLTAVRMTLRHYFVRRLSAGYYTKHVLIVAPRAVAAWLANYFAEEVPKTEYDLIGYATVPNDVDADHDGDLPVMGDVTQLGDMLISKPVDEVIAVQPNGGAEWMPSVIETCDALGILLRIIPQGLLFGKVRTLTALYPFQLLHLPAVVLMPPHFDSDALFFKRLLDILVSAMLLVVLSPLFLLIAAVIKITDRKSDVFYRWKVVGRNGVRFTGYKFTTMYSDADERRKELLDKNEMTGPVFKIKDDPRVTPVGRILRKFSLNELPQLWSVLKGDMSLVGPRPAFPHELEGYGFWHKRKLSIRPGITCLWQVRGRNKISNFDDWVKMDLEYIDNWSLWLDFKILVRTAWAVVAGTGS